MRRDVNPRNCDRNICSSWQSSRPRPSRRSSRQPSRSPTPASYRQDLQKRLLLCAGDGHQAGLLQEGEIVLQVPVLCDPGVVTGLLNVDGIEVHLLALTLNAVV